VVEWVSLIKSLDVPLINIAIRDVSESSRSSPRPMQPNPKPGFSDENNRHELLLTWIISGCQHGCWCGCLRGWYMAAYVDDTWHPTWTMTWHLTWMMTWPLTLTLTFLLWAINWLADFRMKLDLSTNSSAKIKPINILDSAHKNSGSESLHPTKNSTHQIRADFQPIFHKLHYNKQHSFTY
jgi:hypothetical protein